MGQHIGDQNVGIKSLRLPEWVSEWFNLITEIHKHIEKLKKNYDYDRNGKIKKSSKFSTIYRSLVQEKETISRVEFLFILLFFRYFLNIISTPSIVSSRRAFCRSLWYVIYSEDVPSSYYYDDVAEIGFKCSFFCIAWLLNDHAFTKEN